MREVVIVAARRSPIGRIRGALSSVRPDDLLASVFSDVVKISGLEPADLDEVVAGCANQAGEDNRNVARMASLIAGLPYEVPALTVNRLCASGLDAVIHAFRAIATGDHEIVLAGGVENMTRAPLVMAKGDRPYANGNRQVFDSALGWRFPNDALQERFPLESMGETAENIAEKYSIPRHQQDEFALRSHQRAIDAIQAGRFVDEIVPISVKQRRQTSRVDQDEGPRADSTLEKLGALKAVFRKGGSVTAGNSSTLNDGAAALLLMSKNKAASLGLEPLARVLACASAGVDPRTMGLGPVPATRKVLQRAGLSIERLDLVELNEAFAVQALAVMKDLQLDPEKTNVNGGAIALGHPLGCSGARILTTAVHELRRRGGKYALATLCVGVGQGVSVIIGRD